MIAISYDPVSTLRAFSDKYQITYPLLADEGSEVIKSFGIFNAEVDSGSRGFGIPHPGIYVIDENLRVVDKHFEQSYRARPTAENLLVTMLKKKQDSNVHIFEKSYLIGSIAISDTVAYRSQLLSVQVDIDLKDGFHLYGKPIPEGFIPLDIEFESSPNFEVDEFTYPETKAFKIESLQETFHILPDKINLKTFLRIKNRPEAGKHTVTATVTFQACNDRVCMIPEKLKFDFPLRISTQRL